MTEVAISDLQSKFGTSCIICNNFIELQHPYLSVRRNEEYVCADCKQVILALKQVGVQRILKVLNEMEEE